MRIPPSKRLSGFTLVELIVAMAMFTVVMLAVTQIFGTTFQAYRDTRSLQRNLESAQFAMNLMAKEIRTSSVVKNSNDPVPGVKGNFEIRFIDYSQGGGNGACILYQWDSNNGTISKWSRIMGVVDDVNKNRSDCETKVNFGAGDAKGIMIENVNDARVKVTKSEPKPGIKVGKVSLSFQIGTTDNNKTIQTTVSLRDYNYTEL